MNDLLKAKYIKSAKPKTVEQDQEPDLLDQLSPTRKKWHYIRRDGKYVKVYEGDPDFDPNKAQG